MDIKRPVCIVTGGSEGIGIAIAQKFSAEGYQVYNLDLKDFSQSVKNAEWRRCDVSCTEEVLKVIDSIGSENGKIDVLVSNAGVHFSATIEDTSEQEFDRLMNINVKGAYAAVRAVLPFMKKEQDGSIILMASDQALVGKENSFIYNLTKTALASMAKTTALDYARYNIRANAVCPGTIATPLFYKAIQKYCDKNNKVLSEVENSEAKMQPLGRLGTPEEVAELTYFLAGNKAKFITGSLYSIDGGYTAQ